MTITRWEPFRDLLSTQDRFNRLFNQAFGRAFEGGDDELSARTWAPAVDVYETEGNLVVKAELPGVDPKCESRRTHFTSRASASLKMK